jgi:hypothetical protein
MERGLIFVFPFLSSCVACVEVVFFGGVFVGGLAKEVGGLLIIIPSTNSNLFLGRAARRPARAALRTVFLLQSLFVFCQRERERVGGVEEERKGERKSRGLI